MQTCISKHWVELLNFYKQDLPTVLIQILKRHSEISNNSAKNSLWKRGFLQFIRQRSWTLTDFLKTLEVVLLLLLCDSRERSPPLITAFHYLPAQKEMRLNNGSQFWFVILLASSPTMFWCCHNTHSLNQRCWKPMNWLWVEQNWNWSHSGGKMMMMRLLTPCKHAHTPWCSLKHYLLIISLSFCSSAICKQGCNLLHGGCSVPGECM